MPKVNTKKVNKQEPQKMVSFGTAIANFWKKYFDFNGVAQRSEYWFAVLFLVLVGLPLSIISEIDPVLNVMFYIPWELATLIPGLALMSRRFHDAGFSFKWFWLTIISFLVAAIFVGLISMVEPEMFVAGILAGLLCLGFIGFWIFWLVIELLPSKLKNNPYRK